MRAHPDRRTRPWAGPALVVLAVLGVLTPAGALGATEDDRHRVRPGDTLSGIAARLDVEVEALAEANGITDPDRLLSGTTLSLPAASRGAGGGVGTHEVSTGETLSGIAAAHGRPVDALARANGLSDPDLVLPGTTLVIPAAPGSTTAGTEPAGADPGLPGRLREVPGRLALMDTFDAWAATYGVPADLVKATTWLESGWQRDVVSADGAIGIGQLMPVTVATVEDLLGTDIDPWSTDDNIRASARYLAFLADLAGGDTDTALAYYYQGPGSVQRHGISADTQNYVEAVSALRGRF